MKKLYVIVNCGCGRNENKHAGNTDLNAHILCILTTPNKISLTIRSLYTKTKHSKPQDNLPIAQIHQNFMYVKNI
jgi:hypothetical protein